MRLYEVTFIVDDQIGEESIKTEIEKIENLITNGGGKTEKTDTLGSRKFAYPIKKKDHGYYGCIQFRAEPSLLPELESSLRLDEAIIRYLIVVAPKRDSEVPNEEENAEAGEEE